MLELAVLREHFEQMLQAAESAAGRYESLAAAADDETAREQFRRIARDEARHVGLAERLLEIVGE